jgi:hypothetical protein
MIYVELTKGALLLNLILLFFLMLVYSIKLKHNVLKKKFLIGLLLMVALFMVKSGLGIFYLEMLGSMEFFIIIVLEIIAFATLLFGELSDLKHYVKEYYNKN